MLFLLPCIPEELVFPRGYDSCLQDHSLSPTVVPSEILSSLPGRESSSILLASPWARTAAAFGWVLLPGLQWGLMAFCYLESLMREGSCTHWSWFFCLLSLQRDRLEMNTRQPNTKLWLFCLLTPTLYLSVCKWGRFIVGPAWDASSSSI